MSSELPRVGVGCIVFRNGQLLMVRTNGGYWSTPGGNLEFGESPAECAARETAEEAGIRVSNLRFVAVTNDVMEERGSHYVTIWMRGDPENSDVVIRDTKEVEDAGWFDPGSLPEPRHAFFQNLLSSRCMPSNAPNELFGVEP